MTLSPKHLSLWESEVFSCFRHFKAYKPRLFFHKYLACKAAFAVNHNVFYFSGSNHFKSERFNFPFSSIVGRCTLEMLEASM